MKRMPSDPVDDALSDLRVSGSVLIHESYRPPFAIAIPDERRLRALLGASSDARVFPFHLVWRGGITIARDAGARTKVREREVAICPDGRAHRIGAGACGSPARLETVLSKPPRRDRSEGDIECICGIFMLDGLPLNPLLAAMPSVIKVQTRGDGDGPTSLLDHASNMLFLELSEGRRQSFTAHRLLEIFFAEAIRAFLVTGSERVSWFRGLADPKIGTAIARVHARPEEAWTVPRLAAQVAMSPSRFAARFRETVGQSAMSYVTDWRMHVACRTLRSEDVGVAQVAERAGYENVAAFSRAFRSRVGESPGKWRTTARSSTA